MSPVSEMMDLPPDPILELPDNITATYLSEGAANVVYTINVPSQNGSNDCHDLHEKQKSIAISPWHGMFSLTFFFGIT